MRKQIALVGQEPRLFGGSIRDNICLGIDMKPTNAQIEAALNLANASTFVHALPEVTFFLKQTLFASVFIYIEIYASSFLSSYFRF